MNEKHRWAYCETCESHMVVCGFCGNNCCNGGSGGTEADPCPDGCKSAYALQDAGEGAERLKLDLERNQVALKKWDKRSLWGSFGEEGSVEPTGEEMQKRTGAAMRHMLRNLSRGRIPNVDWVMDTLTGKTPVPACGSIGCFIDMDHVH